MNVMEEDVVNIVDDEPAAEVPEADQDEHEPVARPKSMAETARQSARLRSQSHTIPMPANVDPVASTSTNHALPRTRGSAKGAHPKLKFKLSEKAAAQAPGMSFLGQYDRELDSDPEEELEFEEQFILRMPPGEDCEKLRKIVSSRDASQDVWFKFKDSRRAVFHIDKNTYSAKLVDLPAIIEAQKTLDNKQMFKVADICQMLVVENQIADADEAVSHKNFNIEEFIYPHGITPPLRHVRKRRFRKRINRRMIESVEQEVERLLDEDAMAAEVKYEVLENVNPDLSDSEFIERDDEDALPMDAPTPAGFSDAPTPAGEIENYDDDQEPSDDEDEDDEGQEGDIDEELAAELDLALEGGDDGDLGDSSGSDESDEEEEGDEDDEEVQAIRLLNEEIRDLENAVAKKGKEIQSSNNPLIRKRFEDALKKLSTDLELKTTQRDEMKEKQRMVKEGIPLEGPPEDEEEDEDDLFGDDPVGEVHRGLPPDSNIGPMGMNMDMDMDMD